MDLDLTDDQNALVEGVAAIVQRHLEPPRANNVAAAVYHSYGVDLERDLETSGFLDLGYVEGLGPLDAVLAIEQVFRAPSVVELAGSMLIAPGLVEDALPRPIAIARAGDLARPIRFLDVARTLLVDMGEEAAILALDPGDTDSVETLYAFSFGVLCAPARLAEARRLGPGSGAALRRLWQVSLAAEIGAAMAEVVRQTVDYVKERHQFGRAIASFQAVKHRLAEDAQRTESIKWLARKAAWSGDAADAASAALYAQMSVEKLCHDAHQFHGAIGLTLEHPLHFWTMRLRALQGELGGRAAQSTALATRKWRNTQ